MKWVREHIPDFPLPPVLAYQSDATRSDLDGCAEYILMGKVPGVPLQLLEPVPPPPQTSTLPNFVVALTFFFLQTLNEEDQRKVERQIIKWIIALRKASIGLSSQVGALTSQSATTTASATQQMVLGPILTDGPPLGPFPFWSDHIIQSVRWAITEIHRSPYLGGSNERKEESETICLRLETFLETTVAAYAAREREDKQDHEGGNNSELFSLCYDDWHPGNIMVDPDTLNITAILDWEHAKYSTHLIC